MLATYPPYWNSVQVAFDDVTATGIPEPASVLVWGLLGLVGAGFAAWRRKRAA
jgi:LPXTG-motif cell wall-anchored protein